MVHVGKVGRIGYSAGHSANFRVLGRTPMDRDRFGNPYKNDSLRAFERMRDTLDAVQKASDPIVKKISELGLDARQITALEEVARIEAELLSSQPPAVKAVLDMARQVNDHPGMRALEATSNRLAVHDALSLSKQMEAESVGVVERLSQTFHSRLMLVDALVAQDQLLIAQRAVLVPSLAVSYPGHLNHLSSPAVVDALSLLRIAAFDHLGAPATEDLFGHWVDTPWPEPARWTDAGYRRAYREERGYASAILDLEPDVAIAVVVANDDEDAALPAETLEIPQLVSGWRRFFEGQLRAYIETKLHETHGEEWFRLGVRSVISEKRPSLDALDFGHLEMVLISKTNRAAFKTHFPVVGEVQEGFRRMNPIRHDEAHSRPISQDEALDFIFEAHRICIRIGVTIPRELQAPRLD